MKSTALEFILSLSLMLICGQAFASPSQDPFESIEHFELPNGMHVYLAPNADAKLFGYRLDVQVGTNEEVAPNFGVSHLLEHVLFRNRSLKNEMSYLQLIEEAGGDANGETASHRTSFYAKVPAKKAEWLMNTLATMILDPQITPENVAKERGTVELERGRPNPIAEVLGFDIMTYLNPSYLNMPPFWKTEFEISDDQPFTLTEEQLSTQRLTALQAQNHYQNYYHPANMVLFVAGKFDQQKILEQIYARWGQIPSRSGLPPRIFKIPKIKKGPYVLKSVTDGTPEAKLGTKLWKVTAEEYEVANSYVEFLAHRLMKEIRNVSGETYTARGYTSTDHGFGFSFVSFDTTASHFYENVKKAQKYITEEAATGQMKDDQVYEALKLQISYYDLQGHEVPDLLIQARQLDFIRRHYGESISPYKVLSTITPERYNEILKKVFTPDQEYIATTAPPLLFRYDLNILEFLFAITTLFFLRIFLTKEFKNDQVRWIRNLRFPPLKTLELFTMACGLFTVFHFNSAYEHLIFYFGLNNAPIFFSKYFLILLRGIFDVTLMQGFLCLIPRKLIVMNKHLVVKSISYYSYLIPLSEISSVGLKTPIQVSLEFWLKVKFRYYFYNPKFWQKGLLVNLKDGRSYFFGVTSSKLALLELQGLLAKDLSVDEKASETSHGSKQRAAS